jgi:hypothetical protein
VFHRRPPPLHEGLHFVVAQHTKVATRLSVLWVAVSLAAQSILECLLVDVSQAGVVGEIVTSSPLKRMVSPNQDHYGVPLPM